MKAAHALLAATVAAVMVGAVAFAAERVSIKPASQAFAFLGDYYRLDPVLRSRFTLAYRLQEKGRTTPAKMTLVDSGAESPLPVSPDGWLTRLPSAAALARGAQVRVEVAADAKPGMTMIPEAVLRDSNEIEVADLAAAAAQVAAATRKVTGPLSFAFPKFNRVLFSGADEGLAVDADGRATPLPVWRGTPVLDLTTAANVRTVRFKRAPYHALLAPPAR